MIIALEENRLFVGFVRIHIQNTLCWSYANIQWNLPAKSIRLSDLKFGLSEISNEWVLKIFSIYASSITIRFSESTNSFAISSSYFPNSTNSLSLFWRKQAGTNRNRMTSPPGQVLSFGRKKLPQAFLWFFHMYGSHAFRTNPSITKCTNTPFPSFGHHLPSPGGNIKWSTQNHAPEHTSRLVRLETMLNKPSLIYVRKQDIIMRFISTNIKMI